MAHGTPDWGSGSARDTPAGAIDFAELGARLGAVTPVDRLGAVLFWTRFGDGLVNVTQIDAGAGDNYYLLADPALPGGLGLTLSEETGTGTDIGIMTVLNRFDQTAIGFEFALYNDMSSAYNDQVLKYYDGSTLYEFGFRIDYNLNELQVQDDTRSWVAFGDPPPSGDTEPAWDHIKLVADLQDLRYVKLQYNGKVFDLSAYTPWSVVYNTYNHVECILRSTWYTSNWGEMTIGEVIVTQENLV